MYIYTEDARRDDVVQHPRKVKPAMCLCEQKSDENIVENPREWVGAEEVERDDVGQNLHAAISKRMVYLPPKKKFSKVSALVHVLYLVLYLVHVLRH
jgi:hypothetical protein